MRSAFIIMQDFGHKGLEAYPVTPELTRRGMIDLIVTKEIDIEEIAWIWFVCDYEDHERILTEDITEEILSECRLLIERKDDFRLPEAAE